MKRGVLFTAIVLFLLASQAYSNEPSRASWQSVYGPAFVSQDHYVVGGNSIRFWTGFAFPVDWRNEFEIGKIAWDHITHASNCHVARVWRWTTVPETGNSVFILAWLNLDNRDFGWSAIKNTKKHWYVASDQRSWTTQANYTTNRYMDFTWLTNGKHINIQLQNPDNENGWTSEDIWYSFYY